MKIFFKNQSILMNSLFLMKKHFLRNRVLNNEILLIQTFNNLENLSLNWWLS